MTRRLTDAVRRALASSRKVLGPAGAPARADEEEEDELTSPERPIVDAEEGQPEPPAAIHRPLPPPPA